MPEATHVMPDDQPDLSFGRLPLGSTGARGNGWYGMAALVATEACLFAYLLFSYYYMSFHYGAAWFPSRLPEFKLSVPMTALLFASSGIVWIAERAIRAGRTLRCALALTGAAALGLAFVALEAVEWAGKDFTIATNSYSSFYFTVTGFHMAHVVGGVLMLLTMAVWTGMGKFDSHRRDFVSIGAFYWHFVDVVWVFVFTTIYVMPRLFT